MTQDTTITDELAACPFCGGRGAVGEMEDHHGTLYPTAYCTVCSAEVGRMTKAEAITAWNTRKETPTEQAEVARLPWEFLRDVVTPPPFHHNERAWTIMARLIERKIESLSHPVSTNMQVAEHPIIREIMVEVEKATRKFPTWPTRIIDAGNVLSEEAGEVAKAILQCVYEPHKSGLDDVREEVVQTAAMCFRFLASMDRYDLSEGPQHHQPPLAKSDCLQCGSNPAAVELCDDCERTFLSTITAAQATTEGG